jgi:hypothetical protein
MITELSKWPGPYEWAERAMEIKKKKRIKRFRHLVVS